MLKWELETSFGIVWAIFFDSLMTDRSILCFIVSEPRISSWVLASAVALEVKDVPSEAHDFDGRWNADTAP